jgi:pyruvate/2-oxoglutarate dehydrogenase complex dihydrolipoamide dehydrogenase (E3) component
VRRAFDAIVVGAGQAGPPLAVRIARAGRKVALIERKLVGGTCVNTGCTPTKALVASARVAQVVRGSAQFGVEAGPPHVDMARIKARAMSIAANSRKSVEDRIAGTEGLALLRGQARFTGPREIVVNGETLTAPQIFLNVGARPSRPQLPGLDDVPWLTSTTILDLGRTPGHLVVVGGSYIGLEFAQMHRRFGAEVTIVERGEALAPREDPEISAAIRQILEAEGVVVRTAADCIALAPGPRGARVRVNCAEGAPEIEGTHVLLAVGRTPNTDDLGLEAAGLDADRSGYLKVNDRLETSAPGVWALGDCNGRGGFTHTSWNDYEIVAANLLDGADRKVTDRKPGYALYIDPPLGRAGMTEAQARKNGHRVRVAARPMSRVGRAVEKGETQGLMKVVVDADTEQLLGAAILGPGGDEAVHGVLDMMSANAKFRTLERAVPIHPTVSELIPTLLSDLSPAQEALHD